MIYIFLFITLVLAYKIANSTSTQRMGYFLFSCFFLRNNLYVIENPGISAHLILNCAYIISLIKNNELNNFKELPIKKIIISLSILIFILGFMTPHYDLFHKIYEPSLMILIEVFPIFIGYSLIKKQNDIMFFLKVISIIAFISSIYCLIVYFFKINPYDILTSNIRGSNYSDFLLTLSNDDRGIRVNGICSTSHLWGYMCTVFIIIQLHFIKFRKTKFQILILILCFAGLILSKSRSSLIATLLGIITIIYFQKSKKYKISITTIGIILFFTLIYFNFIDISFITDIFREDGGHAGGSNLSLRERQLDTALSYFYEHPLWGSGLGYFHLIILKSVYYDSQLMGGFESDLFIWLIERGIIYIILSIILIFKTAHYIIKKNKYGSIALTLGISLWVSYWFNAFATGSSSKTEYAFLLIGICLKISQIINKNESNNISRRLR